MLIKSVLLAAFALVACGPAYELDSADALKRARVTAPTYALKTTDAMETAVWKTTFPIYSTYTLFLATEITGTLSGHHVASVYLIAPGATMYQRLDAPFATDVLAAPGEQQAVKTSTGWRVWVSVPVAGTQIQQLNMSGAWSGEVWVDAATTANAKAAFTLN